MEHAARWADNKAPVWFSAYRMDLRDKLVSQLNNEINEIASQIEGPVW